MPPLNSASKVAWVEVGVRARVDRARLGGLELVRVVRVEEYFSVWVG
jgi:hypothetical protein